MALFKHRTKINLETMSDIKEFVEIASTCNGAIYLEDGTEFRVSAKSMLGAMATVEWSNLYVVSEEDIYSKITKFTQ